MASKSEKVKAFLSSSANVSFDYTVSTGLSLIPGIGGALSNYYNEMNNQIKFNRLEEFFEELSGEIAIIKDNRELNQNLNREEIGAIIENISIKVGKEPSKDKRDLFKKVFKSSLYSSSYTYDRIKIFTDTLYQMNIIDMDVLHFLYKQKTGSISVGAIAIDSYSPHEIYGAVQRLKNYGFLTVNIISMTIGSPQSRARESAKLNDYGSNFIDFCMLY